MQDSNYPLRNVPPLCRPGPFRSICLLERQNMSIEVSEPHKIGCPTDYEALGLRNVQSGILTHFQDDTLAA